MSSLNTVFFIRDTFGKDCGTLYVWTELFLESILASHIENQINEVENHYKSRIDTSV